jgi:hypothetical protein
VQASLGAVCPKCGKVITPAEVRCIDFGRMECPAWGDGSRVAGSERLFSLGLFQGRFCSYLCQPEHDA